MFGNSDNPRVKSFDLETESYNEVCYFLVQGDELLAPGDPHFGFFARTDHRRQSPLERWQQRGIDGLWTLALERDYLRSKPDLEKDADIAEWEDRLSCSVLFLFNVNGITEGRNISGIASAAGSPIQDKLIEEIPIESFTHILTNITIDNCSSFSSPIIKPNVITRNIRHRYGKLTEIQRIEYLQGPGYVSSIRSLLDRRAISYPFGAHIMRLATRRDMIRLNFLKETLSLQECLRTYKTEDINTCLRRAAAFGTREDIECLLILAENLDINAVSSTTGDSALHHAAKKGEEGVLHLKILLIHGGNPELLNLDGLTPRQMLAQKRINIDDIISGNIEKKKFIERLSESSIPDELKECRQRIIDNYVSHGQASSIRCRVSERQISHRGNFNSLINKRNQPMITFVQKY